MNTERTNTTPGEGTPPTSAPSHSHGGQGQNIASSGTQSFQDPNVINIAASSGTPESIGEALPGTIGTKDTRVNKGTLKGEAASSGTSGAASAAHHTATTQQDNSDYSESSGQSSSISTNRKKGKEEPGAPVLAQQSWDQLGGETPTKRRAKPKN